MGLAGIKSSFRKFSRAAILSAVLFSGCMTTEEYIESNPTGRMETVVVDSKTDSKTSRTFNISDISKDYTIKISESDKRENFITNYIGTKKEIEEIKTKETKAICTFPLWTLILGGAGLTGSLIMDSASSADLDKKIYGTLLVSGLAGLLGMGIDIIPSCYPADKKLEAGSRYFLEPSDISSYTKPNGSQLIIKYASDSNIILSIKNMTRSAKTDSSGKLDLSDYFQSKGGDLFLPGETASRSYLEKIIRNTPLAKQIRDSTLDNLMNNLLEKISRQNALITVRTNVFPFSASEQTENSSKSFPVNYYELSDDAVYAVVKNFIDAKVNSSMKKLVFDVKDITTHIPISGSILDINSDSPSKAEILGKYFTGDLEKRAESFVADYLSGTNSVKVPESTITFGIYPPSKISLEAINPDYKYITGNFSITADMKKTIYMVDKGSKIRVENEADSSGKIE